MIPSLKKLLNFQLGKLESKGKSVCMEILLLSSFVDLKQHIQVDETVGDNGENDIAVLLR